MSIPPSLGYVLNKKKKITENSSKEMLEDFYKATAELLGKSNIFDVQLFALIQEYEQEKTVAVANAILMITCVFNTLGNKLIVLNNIVLARTLGFPLGIQKVEIEEMIKGTDVVETADEPIRDFYNAFVGKDAKAIVSSYTDVKESMPICTSDIMKEAIVVRIFQVLSEEGEVDIEEVKKMITVAPWFFVEITLLKRTANLEFNVVIDLEKGKFVFAKKDEGSAPFTVTEDQIANEKKAIMDRTKQFKQKMIAIEAERERIRLAEEKRRLEEEEDERLEREAAELKIRKEEEMKQKKKEEIRKMKADNDKKMQDISRMQFKVQVKENKDRQRKELFDKYYYNERARRMVEQKYTKQKTEEEAEEIKAMYQEVCDTKQNARRAEHERILLMKKKFTDLGALQTWLNTIGKGESEEEKQEKAEKLRKEKEEAERLAKEQAEKERLERMKEQDRKREEQKKKEEEDRKRREEEYFKKNQERLQEKAALDKQGIYQPSIGKTFVEDKEGWYSKKEAKKPTPTTAKNTSVPSFTSRGSSSPYGRTGDTQQRTTSAYQPPRAQGGMGDRYQPPSSGRRDIYGTNTPSTGGYAPSRTQGTTQRNTSGVPSFSSGSGVPSFSSGKRGGRKY